MNKYKIKNSFSTNFSLHILQWYFTQNIYMLYWTWTDFIKQNLYHLCIFRINNTRLEIYAFEKLGAVTKNYIYTYSTVSYKSIMYKHTHIYTFKMPIFPTTCSWLCNGKVFTKGINCVICVYVKIAHFKN